MARKRTGINTIRGERLRSLLENLGMEQQELANKIGYSKEHISYIINGKRNLTQGAAEAIVKIFPEIRVGWLLGYEDYSTNYEYGMKRMDDKFKRDQVMEDFIDIVVKSLGYELEAENGLFLVLKDGKNMCSCPNTKYIALCNEIWHYARYLAKELISASDSQKESNQNTSEENEGDNNG